MDILSRLQRSPFRSSFRLGGKETAYVKQKGLQEIAKHAEKFITERLKARPENDGRQTPWKGHPVFIAQHATATCCRCCLEKWHTIPQEMVLEEQHLRYCSNIILRWIEKQMETGEANRKRSQ